MKKVLKAGLALALLLTGLSVQAQTKQELAKEKGTEAVKLMDAGKVDESLKLLADAQKLDPDNLVYIYETAFAYQLKKEYKQGIKVLEKVKGKTGFADYYYGMLGSLYDYDGQSEKAIKVYDEGLKKFPRSGKLCLEKGVTLLGRKDYNQALETFEKGIEVEPVNPSNYYWASKLYLNSDNEIWGMLYGEIFMNMERNTRRTAEISKMLFDTYKSEIKFPTDTTSSVSFAKNVINVGKKGGPDEMMKALKQPMQTMKYETSLLLATTSEKNVDMVSLNRIRTKFVDNFFQQEGANEYNNILYDYQKKVKDAGHIEAYNYWILMKGDEPAFAEWYKNNEERWMNFNTWFSKNRLLVDNQSFFHRTLN